MAYETLSFEPEQLTETGGFLVFETPFEDGTVQTRLGNQNPNLSYQFRASGLTRAQADAYRDFWLARHGAYEPFNMENIVEAATMQVRFVNDSWKCTAGLGSYSVEFRVQRDYS